MTDMRHYKDENPETENPLFRFVVSYKKYSDYR